MIKVVLSATEEEREREGERKEECVVVVVKRSCSVLSTSSLIQFHQMKNERKEEGRKDGQTGRQEEYSRE